MICNFTFLFSLQVIEKQRLIEFADALRSKLNYFDELENVRFECYFTKSFGVSWLNVSSQLYLIGLGLGFSLLVPLSYNLYFLYH